MLRIYGNTENDCLVITGDIEKTLEHFDGKLTIVTSCGSEIDYIRDVFANPEWIASINTLGKNDISLSVTLENDEKIPVVLVNGNIEWVKILDDSEYYLTFEKE